MKRLLKGKTGEDERLAEALRQGQAETAVDLNLFQGEQGDDRVKSSDKQTGRDGMSKNEERFDSSVSDGHPTRHSRYGAH